MPRDTRNYLNGFIGHLSNIEFTRKKMERLFDKKLLVKRDIEIIYTGLFLNALTYFENFIEELFINLLIADSVHPSATVKAKHKFNSTKICREIIYTGGKYVDWFPYDFTIKRAEIFLKNGKPFTNLDKTDRKVLTQIFYVRNAIAHKSRHSIKMFNKHVIEGLILMPREKTPVGFLRSLFAMAPSQTRYQYYISQIVHMSRKLYH